MCFGFGIWIEIVMWAGIWIGILELGCGCVLCCDRDLNWDLVWDCDCECDRKYDCDCDQIVIVMVVNRFV